MSSIDTLEATTVINADSGYPIGLRTHQRPPQFVAFPLVIAQRAINSSTGNTVETALANVVIPGGLMGKSGRLRVKLHWTFPASANAKNMRVKFAGSVIGTVPAPSATATAYVGALELGNRNNESDQCGTGFLSGEGAGGAVFSAVDTRIDQVLSIHGWVASGGETLRLEGYTVEVLPSE